MKDKKPTWIAISDLPEYVKSLTGAKPSMSTVCGGCSREHVARRSNLHLSADADTRAAVGVRAFISESDESAQSVSDRQCIDNDCSVTDLPSRVPTSS